MSLKIGSASSVGRRVASAVVYATGSLAAVLLSWYFFGPVQIRTGVNVDASHVWTIAWAFQNGYAWGSEILFTYGPLGFLWGQTFLPDGGLRPVILAYVYYALLGFLIWRIFRPDRSSGIEGTLFALAILVGVGALVTAFDAIIFFVLMAGGYFCLERRGWATAEKLLFLLFCALNFYVKYSVTIVILCLLVFMIVWWLAFRRQGHLIWALIGMTVVAGWLAEMSPTSFFQYLVHTWPVASGFSKAMQIWGAPHEWIVFLTLLLIFNSIFFLHQLREKPWEIFLFHYFWISLLCFFAWKQGFVRHDGHAIVGAAFLLLLVLFWLKELFTASGRRGETRWGGALLLLVGALSAAGFFTSLHQHYLGDDYFSKRVSFFTSRPLQTFKERVLTPMDRDAMRERQQARKASLRERMVLPDGIDGPVDFYDHRSGMILAHNLDYRPRPVFQSYSAYTPGLIAKNREFLQSERAPRFLITDLATVNRRPAMLNDGVSWLEIWGRYRPMARERRLLLWEQVTPKEIAVPEPELVAEGVGRLRADLSLEAWQDEALWIELDFTKTIAGRLQNLLFKPSPLNFVYNFSEGRQLEHEIAPGMVKTGFLISPYLDDPKALERFLALSAHVGFNPWLRSPASIRIREDRHLLGCFQENYRYRIYRLNFNGAPGTTGKYLRHVEGTVWGDLHAYASLRDATSRPLPRVVETHAKLPLHLFAHAPSQFSIDSPEPAKVEIAYGLYDGSWQGGNATDGVIFRISGAPEGGEPSTLLWERELRPVESDSDRGIQRSVFAIPEQFLNLILEVDARGNPNWDWSYWGELRSVGQTDESVD